jgi:hypothetical protein
MLRPAGVIATFAALLRSGWKMTPPNVRIGDMVAVTVFAPRRPGSSLDVPAGAPERVSTAAKAGRLVHGIDVTVGTDKLMFGPSK